MGVVLIVSVAVITVGLITLCAISKTQHERAQQIVLDAKKLWLARGDINDDGQYTVADVVLLARYVAGTIDTIPYVPGGD